jgi:hypothetical protein
MEQRRSSRQVTNGRARAVLRGSVLAAAATALLAGCGGAASTTSGPTSSSPSQAGPSVEAASTTAPSSSGSPSQASPSSSSSGSTSAAAARSGVLAVSLAISGPQKALTPGGPAVDFTVIAINGSQQTYRDVQPRLSLGRCSGLPGDNPQLGVGFPATVTLQESSATARAWHDVDAVREGLGMDYILVPLRQDRVPVLNPGQSATLTFRLRLAAQTGQAHERRCPVNVNLLKPPPASKKELEVKDIAIGRMPAADVSLPVTFVN